MKFELNQTKIREILSKLGKVLNAKTSIPILNGILVQAESDCILFTGSDGAESVIHRAPVEEGVVKVISEGSAVFSKDCMDVVKKLKGGITFELLDTTVKISQDKTELSFGVLDAADYPKVAIKPISQPIIFSGKEFADIISKTSFAASDSETRPILTGVNMTFHPDGNVFVATDSHRLGKVTTGKSKEEIKLTIPAKTLDYALKSFDLDKEVFVYPSELQIAFANGNTILYSRLLEGNFPDTSRLIPPEHNFSLVLNRTELLDTLDILATMTKNSVVKMKVGTLFVELAASGETSKGMKEIAFESYDGEEGFQISFSAKYVTDALKSMDTASVKIDFNGAMRPFIIQPVSEDINELQLVLPVRIN